MRRIIVGLLLCGISGAYAQEASRVYFLKDARVIVKPGMAVERASILIKDGKIAAIGTDIAQPSGAEVIDCSGLTAYPGFIHPFFRISVPGITPSQPQEGRGGPGASGRQGGGQQLTVAEQTAAQARRDADPFNKAANLLTAKKTWEGKSANVAEFAEFAKSGYGMVNLSASGGLVGSPSCVFSLAGKDIDPSAVVSKAEFVPLALTARGFGGYPGSSMGSIAFVRQAIVDAQRYGRLTPTNADPALAGLAEAAASKSKVVFDDLTEVSYFMAKKVATEFGLDAIYGFRQNAGAVADLLGDARTCVMLKGIIPNRPTVGDQLASASLGNVRAYFNEVQVGAELDRKGIPFCYAPISSSEPLDGIRNYVRGGLSRDRALESMTTRPAALLGLQDSAGTLEVGKLGNVLLIQGDLFDESSQIMAVFASGRRIEMIVPDRKKAEELKPSASVSTMPANYSVYPRPAESTPAFRMYRNATIWTQASAGIIRNGDIVIRDGKIIAVGKNLTPPAGCEVIDASGKHISPGIWDCHSHTGIFGGVNESTNMITIECRIGDVINHQSPNIYQQLSGGTVGAQQLHGSANAIGGQTSVVKWRWGLRPTEFPVEGAPGGVKFALGQNPIREDTGGFGAQQTVVGSTLLTWRPRTRMGVEESIRRALQLGKEYNQTWEDFRNGKTKVEPRRDLQLEALGEIVSGKRFVHSHGYRADEMLMLIRVVNEFGGRIATLQHVLEGYKIADEMAASGVAGSTFADWWGYKLEAYDAIPYNAALMAARGVSVSVNSDSDNHARRLNQEAAKSIRYGDVSPEKALSFVTIEPARQLGIADRTGSLEVGKDADMVVWTGDPTSIFAICMETYVDGVKRFDRIDDAKQRAARDTELIEAKKLLDTKTNGDVLATIAPVSDERKKVTKSTATFGIGPVKSEAASMRYPRKATLIRGGMVHPMAGEPFVGDVLIGADGKIVAVGKNLSSNGAIAVNARGKHVYPGLIDPITGIGLNEIGQVPASDDSSERGNFHPDYRVERAINPEWETMGVARQQGVLTVLVKPTGTGISGQAALINTEGFTWEDLTIMGGAALAYASSGTAFDFGHDHDEDTYPYDDSLPMAGLQRGGGGGAINFTNLTNQIENAREYASNREAATVDKPFARDERMEAMLLVASGKLPVLLNVNSANDIKAAVDWAEKNRVRVVLYGCSGAGEIAEWLAEKEVPICLAAVYNMPSGEQPVDYFYALPSRLSKAGVKYCLTTNNDKDVRQIRDQAGWAAAYGVDREEAARLITLRAAEVLGIDDRIGAIKPGMDGTLILADGEIIETKTKVLRAWINGREVELTNKQTRLYEKYRARPRASH